MKCSCYREVQKRNSFSGTLYMQGYCIGTKECEDCWCEGDKDKCTFYPQYRKAAMQECRATMTKAEAEEKFNIKIVEDDNDE